MASFLDEMAGSIYAGFKGKLRSGALRRLSGGTGQDGHGRPIAADPTLYPCEGFVDGYSEHTRATAGIPLTDVRVNIFGASLPPGFVPRKDDMVRVDYPAANGRAAYSQWHQLRERVEADPANALFSCQAFEVGAPS